jgi:hypothetical protein
LKLVIDLGSAKFLIRIPALSEEQLDAYSTELFDSWEKHLEGKISIPDYSLYLEVEEGSVKGIGKIAAALYALYLGIGQYDGFVSGVKTISAQVQASSEFLIKNAVEPFNEQSPSHKCRKSSGQLGKLERLLRRVQSGSLTPEDAAAKAQGIFREDSGDCPEFMDSMKQAFLSAPPTPEQLDLDIKIPLIDSQTSRIFTAPRLPPQDRPALPPREKYRVEIWRRSKKQKREIKRSKS